MYGSAIPTWKTPQLVTNGLMDLMCHLPTGSQDNLIILVALRIAQSLTLRPVNGMIWTAAFITVVMSVASHGTRES